MNPTDDPAELHERQEAVCARYALRAAEPEHKVAVALSTLGRMPVRGTCIALSEGDDIGYEDVWMDLPGNEASR
ncbi:hypothetical protein [Burkholderia cepacia]|uniref:hypothetical protein n=1 Tax=Burkholderia cepacia TaxID=292 RepID=UPI000757FB6B|nr:hypothetical protein [Burkholderia cepacia]KVH37945.1 hypothetical protein WS88_13255 [Burkholderia cepacia]